jgi:tetratricopeptide (TPR) repeat protein
MRINRHGIELCRAAKDYRRTDLRTPDFPVTDTAMHEVAVSPCRRPSCRLTSLLFLAGIAAGARQVTADEPPVPEHIGTLQGGAVRTATTVADPAHFRALIDYYDDSLERSQYQEAENAAKQRIEHLLRASDSSSLLMADALTDLASSQRLTEKFEAAIQNYYAVISLLEQSESMLSGKLIDPLRRLGDTYRASGRPDAALPVYERALHLNHVNAGPHNLDQLAILDAMMAAEEGASRPDSALEMIDRMSALHTRRFGPDSEQMLPVLARRAALLNRLGRHQDERLTYLDVVRIIEGHRGESDVSLIEPYSAIGRTYLHEVDELVFRSEPTGQTGETFLKKALDVAQKSPDTNELIRTQIQIQLADYYTVMNAQDKARQNYRSAWQILSKNGHLEQRRKELESPVPIIRPKLDPYANFGYRSTGGSSASTTHSEGYMVARYTVNERGRVTDIEIVEEAPAEFSAMRTRVQRALRESVFRPCYENGDPVRAERQLFRHDFLYVD